MGSIACYALYPVRVMPHSLTRRFIDFIFGRMEAMTP